MAQGKTITEEEWAVFFDAIDSGATIGEACKTISIAYNSIRNKIRRDPVFAERYAEIQSRQIQAMDELLVKRAQVMDDPAFVRLWYQRMGALNGAEVNVINNGIMAVGNVNIDAREELARLEAEEARLAAILAGRAVQN